jgi:DNA modification methylase
MLKTNTIHQGDCVKLLAKLEPGTVDLVFADPPFNIGYEYDVYRDSQSADDYLGWCRQWIAGVFRALKPSGTFWLAIGDEYAAELKIESQRAGFHCRSWVIWYYTFGVNCANGFSRSHTHLFHFVKDPKKFTFVRPNPNIRVKSARQLVYADLRANPSGRLPDNTWITRPQDLPEAFSPSHDTWYFSRVAGTFKEREGFHGCQMPEQLLGRIIRTSSHPYDLVLDPFGGSGTTLCVAKKLQRNFMGFELSADYVRHIKKRLGQTEIGAPLDGNADPIESAPPTSRGKKRPAEKFDPKVIQAVIEAYKATCDGYPAEYVLCDKDLDRQFVADCLKRGLGGSAIIWNRLLLQLEKTGELHAAKRQSPDISDEELDQFGYASEIAWRLIADDFGSGVLRISLEDIFCCPDTAEYFDQLATQYAPQDRRVNSLEVRCSAMALNKRAVKAKKVGDRKFSDWSDQNFFVLKWHDVRLATFDEPGIFVITRDGKDLFIDTTNSICRRLERLQSHPEWQRFEIDGVLVYPMGKNSSERSGLVSTLVRRRQPLLNANAWL